MCVLSRKDSPCVQVIKCQLYLHWHAHTTKTVFICTLYMIISHTVAPETYFTHAALCWYAFSFPLFGKYFTVAVLVTKCLPKTETSICWYAGLSQKLSYHSHIDGNRYLHSQIHDFEVEHYGETCITVCTLSVHSPGVHSSLSTP